MAPAQRLTRPLLIGRLAALACMALAACDPSDPLAARPGGHLVLISIDTLRADHLSCYGYDRQTSPHIDALARESLLFEDVLSCSSSTAPSHMTIMTGVLPRVHGIQNDVPYSQAPRATLLAELMSDQGYVTAAFADGGHVSENEGFDRGFNHFDSRYEWFDRKLDRIEAWLGEAGSEPTFLFVHTYGVHAPYLPGDAHDLFSSPDYLGVLNGRVETLQRRLATEPAHELVHLIEGFWHDKKDLDETDVQHLIDLYDGSIHRIDAGIGRLLAMLEEAGWLDDAWVVVTSDHGEAFREHGTFQHRQVHQTELSVPLLIRPPGGLAPGRRVAPPVSQLDLPPTLLHLLGLKAPDHMQGESLLPLEDLGRDRPRFATGGEGLVFDVAVDNGRKLITAGGSPRMAYDLSVDPGEGDDLLLTPRTDAPARHDAIGSGRAAQATGRSTGHRPTQRRRPRDAPGPGLPEVAGAAPIRAEASQQRSSRQERQFVRQQARGQQVRALPQRRAVRIPFVARDRLELTS